MSIFTHHPDLGCDLCAAVKPLSVALLREPWSEARVTIRACSACSARAWRTIDQPAPVEVVVPKDAPAGPVTALSKFAEGRA